MLCARRVQYVASTSDLIGASVFKFPFETSTQKHALNLYLFITSLVALNHCSTGFRKRNRMGEKTTIIKMKNKIKSYVEKVNTTCLVRTNRRVLVHLHNCKKNEGEKKTLNRFNLMMC